MADDVLCAWPTDGGLSLHCPATATSWTVVDARRLAVCEPHLRAAVALGYANADLITPSERSKMSAPTLSAGPVPELDDLPPLCQWPRYAREITGLPPQDPCPADVLYVATIRDHAIGAFNFDLCPEHGAQARDQGGFTLRPHWASAGYPVEVVPPFDDVRDRIRTERDRLRPAASEYRRWGDGTPLPPLFPDGHKPRGVVAPVIAYGILGVAGLLAIVGDELLEWSEARKARRTARALVGKLGDRRGQ